jgi:N-acetylglutamate synthase-like GNAT family acetyltransferase
MQIRQAQNADLPALLELYTQFKGTPLPAVDNRIKDIWEQILADKNHHVIVGLGDGKIVSTCVILIVPNLTHDQRPYALIENVITDEAHREKGYASAVLEYAKDIAQTQNCYKIMLMTGSKQDSTLAFYERAGFNRSDKTGFVLWLN